MAAAPTQHPSPDAGAKRPGTLAPRIAVLALALAAVAWRAQPDGLLHIYFPALAGDAAIVRAPSGAFALIDGGADPAALTAALGRRMPPWEHSLAAAVLTAADPQRLPGQVAALARYRVQAALAPPTDSRGATLAEWRRLLAEQRTPARTARPGARLELGGATITVLAADDEGALLLVERGATCAVLAHAPPAHMPPALRRCDLLVTPWDLDPRGPPADTARPRHILFSDGLHSDDAPELTALERAVGGARTYHERLHGGVEWVSDGRTSWVLTGQ